MRRLALEGADRGRLAVLALGSHCDDIEIGCGGTILRLVEAYPEAEIMWVVLAAHGERREEASRSAAAFLAGASAPRVELLSFRDSFFPYVGGDIKEYFEQLKGEIEPDVIFTHYRHDLHQDHRLTSELTWNTFRDHLVLEYEVPKYDGDLGHPNVFVPLTEEQCNRKASLLLEHFSSQTDRPWFTAEVFLGLARLRGVEASSPTLYAEAFHGRKMMLA